MPFLKLPREIRDQVYGHVIDILTDVREDEHGHVDIPLSPDSIEPTWPSLRFNFPPQTSFLSFILSCKTVYQELREMQERRYRRPKIDFTRPLWSIEDGRLHGLLHIDYDPRSDPGWRATFSWIGMPLRPQRPTMVALTVLFAGASSSFFSVPHRDGDWGFVSRPKTQLLASLLRLLQQHGTTLGAAEGRLMPRAQLGWVFIQLTYERFESQNWRPDNQYWDSGADAFINDFIAAVPSLSSGPDALLADSVDRTHWYETPHLSWLDRWLRDRHGLQGVVQGSFHVRLLPERQEEVAQAQTQTKSKGKKRLGSISKMVRMVRG